ncbi:MAG TPA: hypothetical protein PKA88_26620, partial [Polyangiaceae bacterium]|nr:hypothetical protein [Polyangiaceae bacterium]
SFDARVVGDQVVANNPRHGFSAVFAPEQLRLTARGWAAAITVEGFGCDDAIAPLQAQAAAADARDPHRIDQRHGELLSWYLNGPLGLEQSFALAERPACLDASEQLSVAMRVDGLSLERGAKEDVLLRDASGRVVLRYHGLHVEDATGTQLAASMRTQGDRLFIDVDASHATFPLHIDPLWSQQAKLFAADAAADDSFGADVSIWGDSLLVGAPGNDPGGSAYVFVRDGASWVQQAKLTTANPAWGSFGTRVSLWGDSALVADVSGTVSAHVFVRSGTTWTEQATLKSDALAFSGFAYAVSIWGDTAAVGAYADSDSGGAVYVFVRNGTTWTQQAKLVISNTAFDNGLGHAVSLSGDTLLAGRWHPDDSGHNGTAHVFVRNGTTWTEQAKLTPAGWKAGAVGRSVALSGDTALLSNPAVNSGAAYVFVRTGQTWTEQAKLTAPGSFGEPVSLSGDLALIGADKPYVFARSGSTWVLDQQLPTTGKWGSVAIAGTTAVLRAADGLSSLPAAQPEGLTPPWNAPLASLRAERGGCDARLHGFGERHET